MQVTLAKVHEALYSGSADLVLVPTTNGALTILPKHEPFVAPLAKGAVRIRDASGEHTFAVDGGVVEVSDNQVTILL